MPTLLHLSWERLPRLLLEATVLFLVATTIFDVIHFTLHRLMNARWRWLRALASLHQAHHDFCDRGLIYHDNRVVLNLGCM